MAQVITIAGERLFALKAQNNQQLDIDTFIFAFVPGQDSSAQIDRNEGLPPIGQRVHTQIVQQTGLINENAVVYSSVLDSLTGPFDFNWVGLYSSVNQTLIGIIHTPTVSKTVTVPGAAGNILNRNFVIEYSGIAELTGITVDAETWQLDYTARLNGMDELTRQLAADMNGKDWFIDDGFKVVPRSTLNTFKVTAGVGYVSGLRVELTADHILTLSSYPQFVYVDAWFEATSESIWKGKVAFTVTNSEMDDYIDVNGRNHYVFKLARITAADVVEDLRVTDGIKQKGDRNEIAIERTKLSGSNENLVKKIKRLMSKRGMYYYSTNANEFFIGFGMGKDSSYGNWGVEYRFAVNGDGLILNRGIYSGLEDLTKVLAPVSLAGTFVTSTATSAYTTTVGDSFTASFTGKRLLFKSQRDTRGGVWKVMLSDGQTRNVSTWSATTKTVECVLFDNLPHDNYFVKFEFLGADPFNAPSGGTARGWFWYTEGDMTVQPLRFAIAGPLSDASKKAISSENSIPDFAISAKPKNASYGHEWVPQHSAVTGVSSDILMKTIIDAEEVANVAGQLPSGITFKEIESFQLLQRFRATNPNGSDGYMWMHYVVHTIDYESQCMSIQNRIEVQQETSIGLAYLAMLVGASENLTRLYMNNGVEINPLPADGSDTKYGWSMSSAMYAGENKAGRAHGVAIQVSSLKAAASLDSEYEAQSPVRVTNRVDGVSKVYWTLAAGGEFKAGDVFACESTYAAIAGVRTPIDHLRSM